MSIKPLSSSRVAIALSALVALVTGCQHDDFVYVDPILSDGAVLQQNSLLEVRGKAAPGSNVRVKADWGYSVSTSAGLDSTWSLDITTPPASKDRHSIKVSTSNISISFSDILVGEVWLAIDQSIPSEPDIKTPVTASPGDSLIRIFNVLPTLSLEAEGDVYGVWRIGSQSKSRGGRQLLPMARMLRDSLDIPIGVVLASYPGAPCRSWVDVETDEYKSHQDVRKEDKEWRKGHADCMAWMGGLKYESAQNTESVYDEYFNVSRIDASSWPKTVLPGQWGVDDLPGLDGVVWYVRSVKTPQEWVNKPLRLILGRLADSDVVYVNQTLVGATNGDTARMSERTYDIPATAVRPGEMMISIRLTGKKNTAGFYGTGSGTPMRIELADRRSDDEIVPQSLSISGIWSYYAVAEIKEDSIRMLGKPENEYMTKFRRYHSVPSWYAGVAFNGMIAPLEGFAMAGAVCHIGEEDSKRSKDRITMTQNTLALIASLRKMQGRPDWPIVFSQKGRGALNYGEVSYDIFGDGVREAQMTAVVQSDNNVGIISLLDLTPENGHPTRQNCYREEGRRLGRLILNKTYGRNIPNATAPMPRSASAHQQVISVIFDNADKLSIDLDLPTAFEVAGPDSIFYPARAMVSATGLTVFSLMVPEPQFVRYGHHDDIRPTLWGQGGQPVPAFFFKTQKEG